MLVGIPYTDCEYVSEIPCTSEAEAVAVACGAWLGGQESLVFMQDAGYLAALNVIVGLGITYDIKIDIHIEFRDTPEHHAQTYKMAKDICETIRGNTTNISTTY